MKAMIVADSHIFKASDGTYWCKTIYGYDFWKRYLQVFDEIKIVSRVGYINEREKVGYLRVDGPRVEIFEIPFFRGGKEYLINYFKINKAINRSHHDCDCAIFRLPSIIANSTYKKYYKSKKPYALEIVADPYQAYQDNFIAKYIYSNNLKKCAMKANGVSYVTQYYLQKKYPCKAIKINNKSKVYFEEYYSTIDLTDEYFGENKVWDSSLKKVNIIHTANNINNNIKGHEVVINVISELVKKGVNARVIFIGDGDKRNEFERLAKELGIEERVRFTGFISEKIKIKKLLCESDLFLFPSKAEGLPRAVIEAMAAGLPCISTPVNGIPELLDQEYLFEPNDVNGFVNKIIELISSKEKMEEASRINIINAKRYKKDVLDKRRNSFYTKLRELVGSN